MAEAEAHEPFFTRMFATWLGSHGGWNYRIGLLMFSEMMCVRDRVISTYNDIVYNDGNDKVSVTLMENVGGGS